ncbi:unnamed protein product, partial [Urochloa humidicola]
PIINPRRTHRGGDIPFPLTRRRSRIPSRNRRNNSTPVDWYAARRNTRIDPGAEAQSRGRPGYGHPGAEAQSRQSSRMSGQSSRIAVVVEDRCRPNKCGQECRRRCPVNATGRQCIQVTPSSRVSMISEDMCIGCGICVKVCPFNAIQIINLPRELDKETTHRYGPNSFKLHRLPVPRPGQVLGLVGTNGIGKSTALSILAGKLKPNLGKFTDPPNWDEILKHFRGSELQKYFTHLLEDKMKATIKRQYVDDIPKYVKGKVGDLLDKMDKRQVKDTMCDILELKQVLDRNVSDLSGGELQRFTIAARAMDNADVYMFDEPSCYLDVKQRLKAAQVIRSLLQPK